MSGIMINERKIVMDLTGSGRVLIEIPAFVRRE